MRFFVTCAKGTEGPLRRELVSLRIRAPKGESGGVSFEGSFTDAMKACLWSRVAMRVLLEVAAFEAPDAKALYAGARGVDWRAWCTAQTTIAVSSTVRDNPELHHSGFSALKVKDAVVDALRDKLGTRPNVNPTDPDVSIVLHLVGRNARLYLDLAGEPLHRRGYRVAMVDAPLKETLAAAVLMLGGVNAGARLRDPMCGSGTFAIEHALQSRRIAPGLRRTFGFLRWPDPAPRLGWPHLQNEARAVALPACEAPIGASDVDPTAVAAARKNAQKAGVEADISFAVADARDFKASDGPGSIVANPPYGERLTHRDLVGLYEAITRAFRHAHGWQLCALVANPAFSVAVGDRPRVSHKLWNGPLQARLLVYDL